MVATEDLACSADGGVIPVTDLAARSVEYAAGAAECSGLAFYFDAIAKQLDSLARELPRRCADPLWSEPR